MTRCRCCGTEIESNFTLCDHCRQHPKKVVQGADPCPPGERECAIDGCTDRRFDHKCICHYHTLIYRRVIWARKFGRSLTPEEIAFTIAWKAIHDQKRAKSDRRRHRKPKTPLERQTAKQREAERKRKEEEKKLYDVISYISKAGPSTARDIPVPLVGRALALGEERGCLAYDGTRWSLTSPR